MRQRLGTVGHPEEDVDLLAELLAEDVQNWPEDAWLSVDDYHSAMSSAASERFMDLLTQTTPLRLFLTTRRRPSWATARRIAYGEIQEIDRRALVMDRAEAVELLGDRPESAPLIEGARGWPAVLGIAALTTVYRVPSEDMPDQLYDYLAEELYRNASSGARNALHRLSLVPSMTLGVAQMLLGPETTSLVEEGARLGAIDVAGDEVSLHPLLRTFLNRKLTQDDPRRLRELGAETARFLISLNDWDGAFQIISDCSAHELLVPLVDSAIEDLLSAGRTQTISHWLEVADQAHLTDPILDLAEAEIAFRQGRFAKAEILATQSCTQPNAVRNARMLLLAGQAAVMDSRDEQGLEYFRAAQLTAETDADRLEAAVGVCFTALELSLVEEADEALAALAAIDMHGVDSLVRRTVAQLVHSSRVGGVQAALRSGATIVPLLDDVKDPLVLTSFLNCYGHLLGLGAFYVDALRISDRHVETATEYRLTFARPHGLIVRAVAHCGLRDFTRAQAEIARARETADPADIHIVMQAAALSARIALCRRDFEGALAHASQSWDRPGSRPMMAEYLAYRGLAHACHGDSEAAREMAAAARQLHAQSVETLTLTACIEAVAALSEDSDDASSLSLAAFDVARSMGGLDSLVTVSRAFPAFLVTITKAERTRNLIGEVLARSNDFGLGEEVGLHVVGPRLGPLSELTAREREVAELVAQGRTNKAIGEQLFISESTVKVHVRHILRKLNAEKRAEIAARIAGSQNS
jgi:ATP/maltotriose-dependent transcriptional regulator MalT